MKAYAFGKEIEFNDGDTLLDILKNIKKDSYKNYLGALVNNTVRGLTDKAEDNMKIKYLSLDDTEGVRIYQTTLRYIMSYAVHLLHPKTRIIYNYSVSRSIFCQLVGKRKANNELVSAISEKMKEIISKDLPIELTMLDIEKAKRIYEKEGYTSKVALLKGINKKNIRIYKTNNYYNYLDSVLAPSTGFTPVFNIFYHKPGIILQYPRKEEGGNIPKFIDEGVFSKYLKFQNRWGQITNASYVSEFNEIVRNGGINELINLCETRHNNMLAELGEMIEKKINSIKLICVSGPSSSGKTTFTNRLRIELMSRGITPLMISLDDYYLGGGYPLNDDGTPDFEHIDALNLELFNQNMKGLIAGEEVRLPSFNFKTRETTFSEPVKLSKKQPILIEGIHGLNQKLTKAVLDENKFLIYIAPQAQLHIDSQTPLSLADIRLIRRMVRDYRDRGADPCHTIAMWDSVRRGEFKWIYPYQENADYVFNSELTYELGALRKTALEVLNKVTPDKEEYVTAKRLIRMIKGFADVDTKWIPCNSILREFVGGSIFYEK